MQLSFVTVPSHAAPPKLRVINKVNTTEGNEPFSLNMEQSAGYPPVPSFQWFLDDLRISNSSINPNVSVYPWIVFSPVLRNQSGNYSMTASTEGGDSTGYFILNVQCKLCKWRLHGILSWLQNGRSTCSLLLIVRMTIECLVKTFWQKLFPL